VIVAISLEVCFANESNKIETKHEKTPTTMQSPRAVGCGLFLGRLDQGLVGNAESTHVNRPKGNACSIGWKMLQILKVNQCRVDHLRQVCSAD